MTDITVHSFLNFLIAVASVFFGILLAQKVLRVLLRRIIDEVHLVFRRYGKVGVVVFSVFASIAAIQAQKTTNRVQGTTGEIRQPSNRGGELNALRASRLRTDFEPSPGNPEGLRFSSFRCESNRWDFAAVWSTNDVFDVLSLRYSPRLDPWGWEIVTNWTVFTSSTGHEWSVGYDRIPVVTNRAFFALSAYELDADEDGDGLPTWWELSHGLDPSFDPDAYRDDDGDGIPNLYEYHNGGDPSVPDAWRVSKTVVGANGMTLADAFASSTPYSVVEIADGVYSGPEWTGLTFPDFPLLVTSADDGRSRGVVLRHTGGSMWAYLLNSPAASGTVVQGLSVYMDGSSNWQSAFWMGGGELVNGEGEAAVFRNVYVRAPRPGVTYTGWFYRHYDTNLAVIAGCTLNGLGADCVRGIYAIDAPDLVVENCSFVNFPTIPSAPSPAVWFERSRTVTNAPPWRFKLEVVNCLLDESFTNNYNIVYSNGTTNYHVGVDTTIMPTDLSDSVSLTNNLIVADALVERSGHLKVGSPATDAGRPSLFSVFDMDGCPRNWRCDIGADEYAEGHFALDLDGDGLTTREELLLGSDPFLSDGDFDGVGDGDELEENTDPFDSRSFCFDLSVTVTNAAAEMSYLSGAYFESSDSAVPLHEPLMLTNAVNEIAMPHQVVTNGVLPLLKFWSDYNTNAMIDINEPVQTKSYGISGHSNFVALSVDTRLYDSDGDTLPDMWELSHGLDPSDPDDAYEDCDGDGLINLHEYWCGYDPLISDGTNTALSVCARSIDDRLRNIESPNIAMPIYEDYYENASNGVFRNNSNCFATNLDFSCLSVWNGSAQPHSHGGTAISKRHVLWAKHWYLGAGSRLDFLGNDGVVYSRYVGGHLGVSIDGVPNNDIDIAYLTEELPDAVVPVALLASNAYERIRSGNGLPVVAVNQDKKAIVYDVENISFPGSSSCVVRLATPKISLRNVCHQSVRNMDSGSPSFIVYGNKLVLIGTHWQIGVDSSVAMAIPQIQAAMNLLCPGYVLKTEDFSGQDVEE